MAETARWALIGSLAVKVPDGKIVNRSYLIGPDGGITATYDKIHMFDVALGDGQYYRESATYEPGTAAVIADMPWGGLASQSAMIYVLLICIAPSHNMGQTFFPFQPPLPKCPAKHTGMSSTGSGHRNRMLRHCRRPMRHPCGEPPDIRPFPHRRSLGSCLADGGDAPGVITATIDPARVADARSKIPALNHDRDYRLSGGHLDTA